MYLLYLDDSGSAENLKERYLVLGGICVYERQVHYFTQELDKIARRLVPNNPETVEFHASEVFSGRVDPWKALTRDQRRELIQEVLGVLANAYDSARAFATIVHKPTFATGRHPMEIAFEDICSRFDRFLRRVDEKGLIILDESTHATRLQELSHQFRTLGTQWDAIRNIVDGPMFVTSRAFRCVQLADHVAYSVFRRYEAKDAAYFDVISNRFDTDRKVIHGISHLEKGTATCMCIGCLSRRYEAVNLPRKPGDFGRNRRSALHKWLKISVFRRLDHRSLAPNSHHCPPRFLSTAIVATGKLISPTG